MARHFSLKTVRRWETAALAIAIGIAGCAQPETSAPPGPDPAVSEATGDRPTVVASNPVLCDLTEQIAQDTIELTCLIERGQDPHVYRATPADQRAIADADLVLYGGYDLEPTIEGLLSPTESTAPQIAVYEEAVPDPIMGAVHDHDHTHEGETAAGDHDHEHEGETAADEHDHEHEDTAAGESAPDPHIWHNAQNGIEMVNVVQANLAAIAPEQTDLYRQNAEAIVNELTEIDQWIQTQIATIPAANRKLITTHDSFSYYAQAYGLEVEGALSGLSTEEKPSASRLTELVNLVKSANVPAIFAETSTNPQLIETVARDANVEVAKPALFVEGPGAESSGAETYQTMLTTNTCTIVNALGGTCEERSN